MLSLLTGALLLLSSHLVTELPAPRVPVAPLEQVFAAPRPYLDQRLEVTFQVRAVPERWNPFITRFGTRDYVAVEVWGDQQYLWIERDFESPLGLLFARRDSVAGALLAEAETYQRFTARVHVRAVFGGRPWAEILELETQRAAVGEGTVLHASRALTLMNGDEFQLARDDLRRAMATPLPSHVRDELARLMRICNRELTDRRGRQERRSGSKLPVRRGS